MPRLPFPVTVGGRTLVAMTCHGQLLAGSEFSRAPRVAGGVAYLDRRCRRCRWKHMEQNVVGRNQ